MTDGKKDSKIPPKEHVRLTPLRESRDSPAKSGRGPAHNVERQKNGTVKPKSGHRSDKPGKGKK